MILTLLQARTSSTRLPGKVLAPVLGEPMLARQIERVRRARHIGALAVATSDEESDDPLQALCEGLEVACWRGSLSDVLGRFAGALEALGPADHVVRLTGDCPLADPAVIDAVIERHLETGADYSSNILKLTYPKGLDVEVVRADLLLTAAQEATDPYEREHVMPFFYRRPERFKLANLERSPSLHDLRWTVDTPSDLAFVRRVYEALYPSRPDFTSADIEALPFTHDGEGRDG